MTFSERNVPAGEKSILRILNILARHRQVEFSWNEQNSKILLALRRGKVVFSASVFNSALSSGLIVRSDQCLTITSSGKSKLRRHLSDPEPFAAQHRKLKSTTASLNGSVHPVIENQAESPLARLYNRKQKNGTRFISYQEYEAGDRLRRDFEKAGLQPSLTSNWQLGASSGNKSRSGSNAAELSEMALDARKRLDKAIHAIGPELTGVTLDICCFLKGFELVERERNWPTRSAKLLLKTALAILARHYGYTMAPKFIRTDCASAIGQWGAADYKPRL